MIFAGINLYMIRKATETDLDFVYKLYMHPEVNPYLLYEPMSQEVFLPIYADLVEKGLKYVYEDNGELTGMFKLIPLSYRTDHIAYLGGLAIHPSFAGKGLGGKMMSEIIGLARSQGFLRIELSVATINERAIHLYEKCGFEREGVLRKYSYLKTKDLFLDEALMSYLF